MNRPMLRITALRRFLCLAVAILVLASPGIGFSAWSQAYLTALQEAQYSEMSLERVHTLTPIIADNDALVWEGVPGASRVLMTTAVTGDWYDSYVGRDYTLGSTRQLWVAVAPEVKQFCGRNGLSPSTARERLLQVLGLPPDGAYIKVVELWANPADLFRPTPDPEITDTTAEYDFPANVSEQHRSWFNATRASNYVGSSAAPWTRLGYTYDYGNPNDKIGLSEYIVRYGSTIGIRSVTTIENYCGCTSAQPDILWRYQAAGKTVVWAMNTTDRVRMTQLWDVQAPWEMAATGDFDSDGKSDLLWRNTATGENIVSFMQGTTCTSQVAIQTVNTAWQVIGTGDFDNDGKTDIYWRNPATGQNVIMLLDGVVKRQFVEVAGVNTRWTGEGIADFDRDGQPDVFWRDQSSGMNVVMYMNGLERKGTARADDFAASWFVKGIGDFDLDGYPDLLVRKSETGSNVFVLMVNTVRKGTREMSVAPASWGWDIAGTGVLH